MRGDSSVGSPSASAACALSSAAMPAVPVRVAEPRMPGPGPQTIASQPSAAAAASSAPTG